MSAVDTAVPDRRRRTRLLLLALFVFALGLRLAFYLWWRQLPGATWIDPDGYLAQGRLLGGRPGGWSWTLEAVRYSGEYFKAPLQTLFLSFFARVVPHSYGVTVALVEIVLGASLVPLVWALAASLHSTRAGWVAAWITAVDFSQLQLCTVFRQEELYIPLLTAAMVLLLRALDRPDSRRLALAAGLTLGLAALARSMPIYFVFLVGVAAAIGLAGTQRLRRPLYLWLAGFAAVVTAYSVFISIEVGHLLPIENIGSYGITRGIPRYVDRAPSLGETAGLLWTEMRQSPLQFAEGMVGKAGGLFGLTGGRGLIEFLPLSTREEAAVVKLAAHLLDDLPIALAVLLAPLGAILARSRRGVAFLLLWIAVNVALVTLANYAGPRFRAPLVPFLTVLAAVVPAAGWRRPRALTVMAALACTLTLGSVVLGTAPRSLAMWPDYGMTPWEVRDQSRRSVASASAAFNAFPSDGTVRMKLAALQDGDFVVGSVSIDGAEVGRINASRDPQELWFSVASSRAVVHVELRVAGPHPRRPVLAVELPRR